MSELLTAAEQALLGACMYERRTVTDAAALVKAEDFYHPRHGDVFAAILSLHEEGLPADPVLLLERLGKLGTLRRVGGAPYVAELYERAAVGGLISEHARIIADGALFRRMSMVGQRIAQRASEGTAEPADLVQWAGEQLAAARDERVGVDVLTVGWEEFIHSTPEGRDMIIPGLLGKGDRLVLTGHGGLGKSTLLQQITVCAAGGVPPLDWAHDETYEPVKVQIFDCENPGYRVKSRLWPMVRDVTGIGQDPRPNLMLTRNCGNSMDLLNPQTALSILRTVEQDNPGLVYIGPVYKLHNADPDKEETAKKITAVLDQVRAIDGACVITEAHHTKEGKKGGSLEPSGSNLWTWWPEFGLGLRLGDGDEAEMMRRCDVTRWRIDRETSEWPSQIEASGKPGLPWARSAAPGFRDELPPSQAVKHSGAPF